jgi:hypothetical protein
MKHELDLGFAAIALLFVATILGQVGVFSVRRWAGRVVPDYLGWNPQHALSDRRFRLALALVLVATWTGIAIALIQEALKPDVVPSLATHLGPLPIPLWVALALQMGHRNGLTFALWATALWLDRSISRRWSQDIWPAGVRVAGFPMLLALFAVALSLWSD